MNGSSYREMSTANAVYSTQATGDDIAVNSITANHINVALDLSVGRQITVGSGIQIGADVGPVGSEYDGIYVTDGTNYVKLSASSLKLKANFIMGYGDNYIDFEDAGILMEDDSNFEGSGALSLLAKTPEDTSMTEKRFHHLYYSKDTNGDITDAGQILAARYSSILNTLHIKLQAGSTYSYQNAASISALLRSPESSRYGSVSLEFRTTTGGNGFLLLDGKPFVIGMYAYEDSLPTDVPKGAIATKEIADDGVYWLVWYDGSNWVRPDGKTNV